MRLTGDILQVLIGRVAATASDLNQKDDPVI
jgi:hypothetical protein